VKSGFWTKDWFAGLAVTMMVILGSLQGLTDPLELWAYDVGVRGSSRAPSDRVAVIAIDDKSIDNLGRWPWPRDLQAQLFDQLTEAGAKVVGTTILYLEPQTDPGLVAILGLGRFMDKSSLGKAGEQSAILGELLAAGEPSEAGEFFASSVLAGALAADMTALRSTLTEAASALDVDSVLAASIRRAGNVITPMLFFEGEPVGRPDQPLADFVRAQELTNVVDEANAQVDGNFPLETVLARAPIDSVGKGSLAVGSLVQQPDADGGLRADPLVISYYEGGQKFSYFPSLALQIAAASLNLSSDDIQVRLGEGVRLGRLTIGTDPTLRLLSFFYSDGEGGSAIRADSFYDVITGTIKLDKYKDKVVLIGATAQGLGNSFSTPVEAQSAPVMVLAHVVSSILNEDFFTQPYWGPLVTWGLVLLIATYLTTLLPRLSAGAAALITIMLGAVLFGTEYVLLTSQAMWIELILPTTLLLLGHLILTTKRFLVTERGKMASDMESAESNKALGLTLQGKGDYDMAFERFRRLAPEPAVLDLLYHLAPEFERKRQFAKAASVYEYIASVDASFRDVAVKLNRSKAMEETVLLGGGAMAGSHQATLLMDGSMEKPTLGRYQVEKELGKGAMGIVYLGKDPKINRTVAIKTMALAQEFDEDEIDEVKERFFREAETAGRLNHPNIVTIFDVGEEHDLAYIAMEFLKGTDLDAYVKGEATLELPEILDIVIASAEALAYAHAQNVVHRDIKPANIMYEPETHSVKLTDFGIARITDSSKTKTGMVLGTPSYMSPEQLAGKKVDGRSDLFSLGVMLFQMTCGTLPFRGDSMATLMFQIANEPHPDILEIKDDLPSCIKDVLDKALTKLPEDRYATGNEMANDLRACKAKLV
jgi:CHASE2 domain-containing sensor protein/tRNA A-37 threonylcarbamoyl transferase component Bud32